MDLAKKPRACILCNGHQGVFVKKTSRTIETCEENSLCPDLCESPSNVLVGSVTHFRSY